jgi:hypothetical protein
MSASSLPVSLERGNADASDAGHRLAKTGVRQAGAQMPGELVRRGQHPDGAKAPRAVIQRHRLGHRQAEALQHRVEQQLVVRDHPPLERPVALPDDAGLDRPAEERPLVGEAEAAVVVQLVGVVLVGSELAGAEAQPPDLADLRPQTLAVRRGRGLHAADDVERRLRLDVFKNLRARGHCSPSAGWRTDDMVRAG